MGRHTSYRLTYRSGALRGAVTVGQTTTQEEITTMDYIEIIEALRNGDILHIRDHAEARRTGLACEAVLACRGRVSMAHAMRAIATAHVKEEPQNRPFNAPHDWKPDGICFVAA